MLIDEMHYRFKLGLDRVASQDRPDFYPNEIDNYLNRAILDFVKERYGTDNKKKVGFEVNQERISNLMNLHIKSPIPQAALTPINHSNGIYEIQLANLDYRYLFLTAAKVIIAKDGCTKTIDHKSWQIDDRKTVYSDPSFEWGRVLVNFGKSSNSTPSTNEDIPSIYFDTNNKKGIQQFTINSVNINYIKYPDRVCIGTYKHIDDKSGAPLTTLTNCDLDDAFHDEIVNIAVRFAHRDIQDQFGYQSSQVQTELDK